MNKIWAPSFLMLTAFISAFLSVAAIQSGSIAGFVLLSICALGFIVTYVMLLLNVNRFELIKKAAATLGLIYVLPAFLWNIVNVYQGAQVSIFSIVLLLISVLVYSIHLFR